MRNQKNAEKISVLATFPPIQSAIKIYGNGDGMRVQLEIPKSEMSKAVYLLGMTETIMRVTFESESLTVLDDETKKEAEGSSSELDSRRRSIRRNQ